MTLPNFIVAGAKKAATTSLYEYLNQHPQIYMSPIKETKFFAYEAHNPEHRNADRRKFPIRTVREYTDLFADAGAAVAIGEASPIYISSQHAVTQIAQQLPKVKLIFSLRNPVERAYSAYIMRVRGGYEPRSVEDAFQEDLDVLKDKTYYKQLLPWYAQFDRAQIKIVLFDDIKKNAVGVTQTLYDFLGVDATFTPDVSQQHMIGGLPKSQFRQKVINYLRRYRFLRFYLPKSMRGQFTEFARANLTKAPALPVEIQRLLANLYQEDLALLEQLIERDLSVWGLANQTQIPQAVAR
jgi:hypothetical protein